MTYLASQPNHLIFRIMSDQPDCCGYCGCRLDLVEIKEMFGEKVFVNKCLGCHQEELIVES